VKRFLLPVVALTVLVFRCSDNTVTNSPEPPVTWGNLSLSVDVSKWHDGHTAAVSVTYDARWNSDPLVMDAADEALKRNIPISFEMVTSYFTDYPELIVQMQEELLPRGITFYGHGHTHDDFDSKSFEYSFDSFTRCYNYMKAWGLNPRAYAYPHGKGFESTTKLANRLAGFICARGLTFLSNPNYICPDDVKEPRDWYYLPCISVAQEYVGYINDHAGMSGVLRTNLEKTAWIIIMYHSIGFPGAWGYYPYDEYLSDLDEIAAQDFWCAPMGTIACYVKERSGFEYRAKEIETADDHAEYKVMFIDRLDNATYDQPLTLDITFSGDIPVSRVQFEPPVNGTSHCEVRDNSFRLHAVPDEQKYRMMLLAE